MEKIKALINANLDKTGDMLSGRSDIEIGYDAEGGEDEGEDVWINIPFGKDPDDFITISFDIEEFLQAFGRAIKKG